jgi:hypothetical protein
VADPTGSGFLAVDLDVYSRRRLDGLVAAFGSKVLPLYVGSERSRQVAHLGLVAQHATPERAIRDWLRLIKHLPAAAQTQWRSAHSREFNVGLESLSGPPRTEYQLTAKTLEAVALAGVRLGLTLYPPDGQPERHALPKRASAGAAKRRAHQP